MRILTIAVLLLLTLELAQAEPRKSNLMKMADFDGLDDADKKHFYKCQQCGEMVDMRQLDDAFRVARSFDCCWRNTDGMSRTWKSDARIIALSKCGTIWHISAMQPFCTLLPGEGRK
jgi:hypothetical protein